MASNYPPKRQKQLEKCPKSELHMVPKLMDSILSNLKYHNPNIQKNKAKTISSINSAQKSEVSTLSGNPHANVEANSLIKNIHNKNSQNKKMMNSYPVKNRSSSSVQHTQKKNVINNNANKPSSRNSNIRQNMLIKNYLNNKPVVERKVSPGKMQVVYKENDKFISSSLNTMLQQINKPKLPTVSTNLTKSRPTISSVFRKNNAARSRSSSVIPVTPNKNAKSYTGRSRSFSKPVNAVHKQQQTIVGNNYMHTKSINNTSSNATSTRKQESVKRGTECKKPSLYVSDKELMGKYIHRSKHLLRPLNKKSRSSRDYNNNSRSGTHSRIMSPVTTNKNTTGPSVVSQRVTASFVPQIINTKIDPFKIKTNNMNRRIQQTNANNKRNIKKQIDTKTDDEEESLIQIHDMEDNSITVINEKLRQIIDEIKEEKEVEEETTPQPENKQENEPPKSDTKPVVAPKISIPNKPVNNNKNQQSKQNINNQQKKSSFSIVKPPTVMNTLLKNSVNIRRNPDIVCLPHNRKFSLLTPMEIIQEFSQMVNTAKRDRKTYTVYGDYYALRRAFAERGWIEKLRFNLVDDRNWRKLSNLSNFELAEGLHDKQNGDKYRRVILSKLLAGHQVDFYWDYMTNPFVINNDKVKKTLINRFPFGGSRSYSSKAGLCESLKEAYWYNIDGYSNILFPRTYNLAHEDDIRCFVEDFRRTAAISLLQWVSKNSDKPASIISPNGQIPTSVFNFASLQCFNVIKIKEHKDIDEIIPEPKEYEWDTFLDKFYKIAHQGNHFKETHNVTAPLLIDQSKFILNKLRKFFPKLDFDGNMNLWLLKPNNGCCGCGIHVCRTLRYTLNTIRSRRDTKYVIQKYLERPLLIHKTKFDIRQYFMITCMPNFQIWLYKDCYLRFSSQMYDLSKLHESIHLTNNSIQCRYRNNCNRSKDLPDQNMWHSDTFRRYLSDIGQPYAWRNTIYKGIKECLIGLFMLCQNKLLYRVNSFELCGADFMLAEDYRPYLIEINSRPALYASTRITSTICPKVLEDVVKVTVDYYRNPRASTGQFELIYKDTFNYIPPKNLNTIFVEGISYKKYAEKQVDKSPEPMPLQKLAIKEIDDKTGTIEKILKLDPSKVRKDAKNTLEKILAVIHAEQNRTESCDEKNIEFRMMLSEFVDIISCNKKLPEEII